MNPRPIPWRDMTEEEVYDHRWLHCPHYEDCLDKMCKPRFLVSWSCIICDIANGKLGQVQGMSNQLNITLSTIKVL